MVLKLIISKKMFFYFFYLIIICIFKRFRSIVKGECERERERSLMVKKKEGKKCIEWKKLKE